MISSGIVLKECHFDLSAFADMAKFDMATEGTPCLFSTLARSTHISIETDSYKKMKWLLLSSLKMAKCKM